MSDLSTNLKQNESAISGVLSVVININGTQKNSAETDFLITSPLYLSISVAAAIGNLVMVLVILCKQQYRKVLWAFGITTLGCVKVLGVVHRIPVPVIALTTMTISLDRGTIARNPMLSSGPANNPLLRIVYIWLFSILIVLPLGLSRAYDPCNSTLYKCSKVVMLDNPVLPLIYGFTYLLSVHIIPAVILVLETSKTINKIRFLERSGAMNRSQSFPMPDNRLRLLRNSCIFCIIFLFFWLPYGVFQFPLDLPRDVVPDILELYLRVYFKFFRNISYCLIAANPAIFFILLLKHIPLYGSCGGRRSCGWRM